MHSMPYVLQFFLIMFFADIVQYWVHRMFHEISWLWKFHAVHHSVQALDWIVGIRQDGRDLGLGERGPLWVVYTYPDGRKLSTDDELRWPWATFYIEIN